MQRSKGQRPWFKALAPRRWTSTCTGSKVILCHNRMAPVEGHHFTKPERSIRPPKRRAFQIWKWIDSTPTINFQGIYVGYVSFFGGWTIFNDSTPRNIWFLKSIVMQNLSGLRCPLLCKWEKLYRSIGLHSWCLSARKSPQPHEAAAFSSITVVYGCFLKWWYSQNSPKWSFFSRKTHGCWVPPF